MAVVTQLYYQVYITYQHRLHVSAIAGGHLQVRYNFYQRSYIVITEQL